MKDINNWTEFVCFSLDSQDLFCSIFNVCGYIRVKSIVLYEYQAVRDSCKEVELDDSLLVRLIFSYRLAERNFDDLRNLANEAYSSLSKDLIEK